MASPPRRVAQRPAPSSRPAPARIHTSYVAVRVQNKLKNAAAEPEWNLSRLVAHANTLDNLAIRMSDPDRKKRREAEELAAAQKESEESVTHASPRSSLRNSFDVAESPREEEEEEDRFHHSDDSSEENDSYGSEEGWTTTEPSTALEHGERADYFGVAGEVAQQASPKDNIKAAPLSASNLETTVAS